MSRVYLGLDSSTQSLTAIAIEVAGQSARVIDETSIAFDEALPQYGTHHGVLPSDDPAVAVSSPPMWADAIDTLFHRLVAGGPHVLRPGALSRPAQQHRNGYPGAPPGEHIA